MVIISRTQRTISASCPAAMLSPCSDIGIHPMRCSVVLQQWFSTYGSLNRNGPHRLQLRFSWKGIKIGITAPGSSRQLWNPRLYSRVLLCPSAEEKGHPREVHLFLSHGCTPDRANGLGGPVSVHWWEREPMVWPAQPQPSGLHASEMGRGDVRRYLGTWVETRKGRHFKNVLF